MWGGWTAKRIGRGVKSVWKDGLKVNIFFLACRAHMIDGENIVENRCYVTKLTDFSTDLLFFSLSWCFCCCWCLFFPHIHSHKSEFSSKIVLAMILMPHKTLARKKSWICAMYAMVRFPILLYSRNLNITFAVSCFCCCSSIISGAFAIQKKGQHESGRAKTIECGK